MQWAEDIRDDGAAFTCECGRLLDTRDAPVKASLPTGTRFNSITCQCGKSYTVELLRTPLPSIGDIMFKVDSSPGTEAKC